MTDKTYLIMSGATPHLNMAAAASQILSLALVSINGRNIVIPYNFRASAPPQDAAQTVMWSGCPEAIRATRTARVGTIDTPLQVPGML